VKTVRILKKKDYWKLPEEVGPREVFTSLPKDSKVIVVEEDDEIIGSWSLIPYYHLEMMWVNSEFRSKGSVARRLLKFMYKLTHSLGLNAVITSSIDEGMTKMINKLGGTELPGKHFVLGVREEF